MDINDYVTRLQATCYDRLGLEPPTELDNKLFKVYEAALDEVHKHGGSPLGIRQALKRYDPASLAAVLRSVDVTGVPPFESAGDYSILCNLVARIERALRRRGRPLPSKAPMFRTLPHGHPNAVSLRLRATDEHAVLFHRGLFGFVYALMLRLAEAMPIVQVVDQEVVGEVTPDKVDSHLARNPDIAWRFTGLLVGYLITGDPRRSPLHLPSGTRQFLAEKYAFVAELFVVAHEYAHVLLGHLSGRPLEAVAFREALLSAFAAAGGTNTLLTGRALSSSFMRSATLRQTAPFCFPPWRSFCTPSNCSIAPPRCFVMVTSVTP